MSSDFVATLDRNKMDALRLRGKKLNTTPLADGQEYVYDATSGELKPAYRPVLLVFGNIATSNSPATEYLDPGGSGRAATANEPRLYVPPAKYWKMRVSTRGGLAGGNQVITLRKSGSDQLVTATLVPSASAITDLTNSFTTVEGDWISVKSVTGSGVSSSALDVYVTLEGLLSV